MKNLVLALVALVLFAVPTFARERVVFLGAPVAVGNGVTVVAPANALAPQVVAPANANLALAPAVVATPVVTFNPFFGIGLGNRVLFNRGFRGVRR